MFFRAVCNNKSFQKSIKNELMTKKKKESRINVLPTVTSLKNKRNTNITPLFCYFIQLTKVLCVFSD